jgi:excisionase family DNA binding protein
MTIRTGTAVADGATPRLAYSLTETAALLGCTRQHVSNMVHAGEIRVAKLGRRVLVPAAELARVLSGDAR